MILVLAVAALALAQPAAKDRGADQDAGFIEYLRRQDPAAAERFITLRNTREAALAEMQQAAERYGAGGPALRPVSLPVLQQARKRYAEASLALLDFLDERDRAVIARLEADVERVKQSLENRAHDRVQLERMRGGGE